MSTDKAMKLQDMCRTYGIRFKKSLGQNLLLDDNINRIMVDAAALTAEDDVLEVGAGLGALTRRLHPLAKRVLSIEIDRSFMPCLEDQFGEVDNVVLFRGDVLNHPLDSLLAELLPGVERLTLVANLPYYITTPILFHCWESGVFFQRMVVMVQAEVGQRLAAAVNAPNYGVLALAAQLHAQVDIVHQVPRTCFMPQPTVDSAIVRLRSHPAPRYGDLDARFIMRVIRQAFAQRRKTLRNTLVKARLAGLESEAVLEALEEAGVDPGRRPQTLSLDEFAAVAGAVRSRAAQ
jgi:16S rRNA (adenine1518-N6/adenine1519-N6)-dimethyltransferase